MTSLIIKDFVITLQNTVMTSYRKRYGNPWTSFGEKFWQICFTTHNFLMLFPCFLITQVYPPSEESTTKTKLQERLIRKLGENAFPFFVEVCLRVFFWLTERQLRNAIKSTLPLLLLFIFKLCTPNSIKTLTESCERKKLFGFLGRKLIF